MLLGCVRDMQAWRQGGWGEAPLGEATAIQKALIPDQRARQRPASDVDAALAGLQDQMMEWGWIQSALLCQPGP